MSFVKLQKLFLLITISASALLVYIWYQDYNFTKNPLEQKFQLQIYEKQQRLKSLAFKHYGITRSFHIIISDKMNANRFGMAVYDVNSQISIHLNKKRFKESANYMITDVLPHEYAHAIMFYFKDFSSQNSGHTKRWQNICKKLEGKRCDRFVNNQDILIEKTNPFK